MSWTPVSNLERAIDKWPVMAEAAHALGHVLSPPDVDTEDSLVGYCKRCLIPFATDGGEAPFLFSAGLSGPCRPTVVDMVFRIEENGITMHGWRK